jgi:hypothetical protein
MTRAVPRDTKSISMVRAGDRRQERKPKPLKVRVVGQLSRKFLGISHKKLYANRTGSALVPRTCGDDRAKLSLVSPISSPAQKVESGRLCVILDGVRVRSSKTDGFSIAFVACNASFTPTKASQRANWADHLERQ